MNTSELARHCHRCGAVVVGTYETVPYVGPGPRVVQLHAVQVQRCATCANMLIEVPESGLELDKAVKADEGISESEQIRHALRDWLRKKGVRKTAKPARGKRTSPTR
jgi:hypothetical protein